MANTAVATLQTIWDCRWSRPGYRLFGVGEHMQPEKLWVCIRDGHRRSVTAEECEDCPRWQLVAGAACLDGCDDAQPQGGPDTF